MVLGAFLLLVPPARRYGSPATVGAGLVLAAWLIAPAFTVSASSAGLLLTAAMFRMLTRGEPGRGLWVVLVAVQVLWTNLHTSFLLGPFIALLASLETRFRPTASSPTRGFALPAALLAATFLNPYAWNLHRTILQVLTSPDLNALLEWISPFQSEFAPVSLRHAGTFALCVIALGFVTVQGRLPILVTTLAVVGAFLLVVSPRYFSFSALLTLPFLSLSFHAVAEWLGSRFDAARLARAGHLALTATALATVGLVASGWYYNRTGSAASFGLGTASGLFPERAVDLVLNRPDFPERVINLAQDGGYLAWRRPGHRVFTDTRAGVYGVAFYQGLARALMGHPESWNNLVAHWQPGAILLNGTWPGAGAALRRMVETNAWALVYYDGTSAIAVTRTSDHAKLIRDFEIQAEGLIALESERRAYAQRLERSLVPTHSPQLIGAGAIALALWRFGEAETIYALLSQGAPTMATAWLNLGICQYHRNAHAEAARSLDRATRLRPEGVLGWLWLGKACEALGRTAEADQARQRARRINASIADSFESGFRPATNTTLPGVSMDRESSTATPR